jgi:hypothetical protein
MKKIALLFMFTLLLAGCDIEDDGPGSEQVLVEVVDADLPEFFEKGKLYQIEVTYLLPDACHNGLGLQAVRGGSQGAVRRDIYVAGVASRPAGLEDCDLESEDLEKTDSFTLVVDEDQPFTFYLWTGVDANQENTYTKIVVPVGEATPTPAVN